MRLIFVPNIFDENLTKFAFLFDPDKKISLHPPVSQTSRNPFFEIQSEAEFESDRGEDYVVYDRNGVRHRNRDVGSITWLVHVSVYVDRNWNERGSKRGDQRPARHFSTEAFVDAEQTFVSLYEVRINRLINYPCAHFTRVGVIRIARNWCRDMTTVSTTVVWKQRFE